MNSIIFDFDGVLADTTVVVSEFIHSNSVARQLMLSAGFDYPSAYISYILEKPELTRVFAKTAGKEFMVYIADHTHLVKKCNEIFKILSVSNVHNVAIVSSNLESAIRGILGDDTKYFTHILGIESGLSKQDKIYLISNDWHVSRDEIKYVTDTTGDVVELNDFLLDSNIFGVTWGYHNEDKLKEVLALEQILSSPQDLIKLF